MQVVRNLEKALNSKDSQIDELFYSAFGSVVLDPKFIDADESLRQVHLKAVAVIVILAHNTEYNHGYVAGAHAVHFSCG